MGHPILLPPVLLKEPPCWGQYPTSALETQGISCLCRDWNLIFCLLQNTLIFTGTHGFFPNYSPANLPFSCIYRFLVCLFVLRWRRKLQGETKRRARQFCSAATVPSLFCQSRERLLLPFYTVWSQVHSCFPKQFDLLRRCYCKTQVST